MKNILQNNVTMLSVTAPTVAKIAASMLLLVLAAFASFSGHAQERSASNNAQFSQTEQGCLDTFNHSLRALHSTEQHDLCELTKDKVVLVVNTASQCGYTGQFADLEAPGWNFHKYLISANGEQVASFASAVKPTNEVIIKAVEELLKAR